MTKDNKGKKAQKEEKKQRGFAKHIPTEFRVQSFTIQLRKFMIDFIHDNKDVFELGNPNLEIRQFIKDKMIKADKWKSEYDKLI